MPAPATSSRASTTLIGNRYGKAQDEEQRLKSLEAPAILTNNTREDFTLTRSGQDVSYTVPPLSVTVLRLRPAPTAPPQLTSESAAEGIVGSPFHHLITATGRGTNYSVGPIPNGLTFNPLDASLSGYPTQAGDKFILLTATNTAGSTTQNLKLSIRDKTSLNLYSQDFSTASGWWSYHGDGGVTGTLSQPATAGPFGGPSLQHQINVAAPPASYWYAGTGVSLPRPTSPGNPKKPTLRIAGISPQPLHLTLSFQRIADPTLTYQVWATKDLIDWDTAPIWSSTGTQNTEGEVNVTDPESLSDRSRRFLQLRVHQN